MPWCRIYSSVSVVQDDNTNKKALLASLDDEPASEVSATAPSPEVPARAPTPTDQLLEDSNTDTPPGAKQGWALLMLRMLDAHCAESVVSGSARTASLPFDETEIRSPRRLNLGFVKRGH